MSSSTTVPISDMIAENRFSAEFFDPELRFTPRREDQWAPIGSILDQCQYGVSIAMNSDNHGYPILRMNELSSGFVKDAAKCAVLSDADFERYRLIEGDVMFNRTNAFDLVGRTAIAMSDQKSAFASYLIRLRPKVGTILPEYLTVYLNTPFGISQVRRRAMRSINQANVSGSEVKKVPIFLLPVDEQAHVAELMRASYEAVTAAEADHKRAIMLLDDSYDSPPPSGVLSSQARASEIRSAGRMDAEFFSGDAVGFANYILDTREPVRLSTLLHNLPTNINPRLAPETSFRYVELADIDPRTGTVFRLSSRTGAELPTRAKRQVAAGDVVASSVLGSLDKVAIIESPDDQALVSTGFFHLRPKGSTSGEFALALVKSKWVSNQLQRFGSGGILSAVPDDALDLLFVPTFDVETVREVERLVESSTKLARLSRDTFDEAVAMVQNRLEDSIIDTGVGSS